MEVKFTHSPSALDKASAKLQVPAALRPNLCLEGRVGTCGDLEDTNTETEQRLVSRTARSLSTVPDEQSRPVNICFVLLVAVK